MGAPGFCRITLSEISLGEWHSLQRLDGVSSALRVHSSYSWHQFSLDTGCMLGSPNLRALLSAEINQDKR